jgi:hypothetical protein
MALGGGAGDGRGGLAHPCAKERRINGALRLWVGHPPPTIQRACIGDDDHCVSQAVRGTADFPNSLSSVSMSC